MRKSDPSHRKHRNHTAETSQHTTAQLLPDAHTQVRYSGYQRTNLALESGQMSMPIDGPIEDRHQTLNRVRSQAPLRDANSTQSTLAFTPLPQPHHAQ